MTIIDNTIINMYIYCEARLGSAGAKRRHFWRDTLELTVKTLSKGLKKLREKRGMTQGDIYRATGLDRSYVSSLERGEIPYPRLNMIYRIAAAFNMTCSEFVAFLENESDGKRK